MSELTDKPIKKLHDEPINVAKGVKQIVHLVEQHNKIDMLLQVIKNNTNKQTVIVTKSKRKADELSRYLRAQDIKVTAIHGNHRDSEFKAVTKDFNTYALNVLITTDMILQSLDLSNIQQIISYDLPVESSYYLSRLGCLEERGVAISLVSPDEENLLSDIEFAIKLEILREVVKDFVISSISEASRASEYEKAKVDRATAKRNKTKKTKKTKKKRNKTSDKGKTSK